MMPFFYFKLCFIIVGYSRLNGCLLPIGSATSFSILEISGFDRWKNRLDPQFGLLNLRLPLKYQMIIVY